MHNSARQGSAFTLPTLPCSIGLKVGNKGVGLGTKDPEKKRNETKNPICDQHSSAKAPGKAKSDHLPTLLKLGRFLLCAGSNHSKTAPPGLTRLA
jgi:hypothetical protein